MSDEELEPGGGEEVLAEDLNAIEPDEIDGEQEEQEGEPQESEAEAKARRMGWAPKDEWRGDETRWKTAEEFLAFMDEAPGVQRERLEKANQKIAEFEGTAEDLKRQLAIVTKRLKDQDKRGYDRAIADIKKQKRVAAENGDMEAFEAYEAEEDKLREEASSVNEEPEKPVNEGPKEPPEVKEWKGKNKWFDADMEMTRAAEGFSKTFNELNPTAGINAMLDYVEQKIRAAYPDKFENPNRREAPRTNSPGISGKGKGKKSFADLPPDAKKACNEFIADGIYKTRDEYVADYFEQEV